MSTPSPTLQPAPYAVTVVTVAANWFPGPLAQGVTGRVLPGVSVLAQTEVAPKAKLRTVGTV
jgi:hypothetical protein